MVVLVVGTVLFHGNDWAMELLALLGFGVAMGVLFFLEGRDERAQRSEADRAA